MMKIHIYTKTLFLSYHLKNDSMFSNHNIKRCEVNCISFFVFHVLSLVEGNDSV